jgi:hypothetical protein
MKDLEESSRVHASLGVLLVAIDNLARVNESYGYDVADEVISAVRGTPAGKRARDRLDRRSPQRAPDHAVVRAGRGYSQPQAGLLRMLDADPARRRIVDSGKRHHPDC